MTFKIGMPVVCVDAGASFTHVPLRMGAIYHIRDYGDDGDPKGPWVRLCEVKNVTRRCLLWDGRPVHAELVYSAFRFRPLIDTKQQVSFTTGAPRDSRKWDRRRKRVEVVS